MPQYTKFRAITSYGQRTLDEQIEPNIVEFLKWGFLGIGAFANVNIPTSGVYGGNFHQLQLNRSPNYTSGQVWEGYRGDWIWESGVEYDIQPIQISGVNVDNTFYPLNTVGTYAYSIDYPRGRVIFDNAISTSSNVTLEYSYRHVQVSPASVPWFRQLFVDSFRIDSPHNASGDWSIRPELRVQMPHIIVEMPHTGRNIPYQLGGGQIVHSDLLFHVFAETDYERKKIENILRDMKDKAIYLFDMNKLTESGAFPLRGDGSLTDNPKTYLNLLEDGYLWKQAYFIDSKGTTVSNQHPKYWSIVKSTIEIKQGDA